MTRTLTALALAGTLALATVAAPNPADARGRGLESPPAFIGGHCRWRADRRRC